MTSTEQERQSYFTPRRIVALVILVLFVVFAVQNGESATVSVLLIEVTGPLWLTLLLSFLLGGAVTWLLLYRRRRE
jgi:uncharacterized integral membrane protein